jgi:hypothetical protein
VVQEATGAEDHALAGADQLGPPSDLDLDAHDFELVVADDVHHAPLEQELGSQPARRAEELVDEVLAAGGVDAAAPARREAGLDGAPGRGPVLGQVGVVVGVVDRLEVERAEGEQLLHRQRALAVERGEERVLLGREPEGGVLGGVPGRVGGAS